MARGRDLNTIAVDRKVREEIIRNCSHPDILREIFDRAAGLAFGRGTVMEFDAFCREQPCILWQPDDPSQRHVDVLIRREPTRTMIHVCRIVYHIVHVVAAQGPTLSASQEALHICNAKSQAHTAFGACLNPSHMVPGSEENRQALAQAKHTIQRLAGIKRVVA